MQNKPFWVAFTSNNARIIPGELMPAIGQLFALKNPDLTKVQGVPPHFWKYEGDNEVIPMTPEEQAARLQSHEQHGVDNGQGLAPPTAAYLELQALKAAARAAWLGGLIAGFFVGGFWGSVITALILG